MRRRTHTPDEEPKEKETTSSASQAPAGGTLRVVPEQRKLAPLVFGVAAAVVLLAGVVWYVVGLPGAPDSLRRIRGTLPEAGPRDIPIPAATPNQPLSLLTGLPCGDAYKRRPIAVMIGSDPLARPLSGFADADLVIEMPVLLNNVTRLMAVYQCGQPSEIGGVRSARHDFLFLAKGLDAVIAHWGGSYHALNRIRFERAKNGNPVYEDIDAIWRTAAGAFYRVSRLPAPYNGYATYDKLWEALQKNKYRTYSTFEGYPHRPELPRAQRGVGTLDVGWPGAERVRYIFNPETNSYDRLWGGEPHLDGVGQKRVSPRAVVVMYTTQQAASGPGGYNDVAVEGTGKIELYQNGQVLEGTWTKSEVHKQDPLTFRTTLGQVIEFIPGQIWIEIVDNRTPVTWTPGTTVPPDTSDSGALTNFGD